MFFTSNYVNGSTMYWEHDSPRRGTKCLGDEMMTPIFENFELCAKRIFISGWQVDCWKCKVSLLKENEILGIGFRNHHQHLKPIVRVLSKKNRLFPKEHQIFELSENPKKKTGEYPEVSFKKKWCQSFRENIISNNKHTNKSGARKGPVDLAVRNSLIS